MALDPRTVSRRFLLERTGFARPDLSIVLPAAAAGPARLDQLATFARERGLSIQVVLFKGSESDRAAGAPLAIAGGARSPALSLLCVAGGPEEPPVEAVNRVTSAAIGEVILLGSASPSNLLAIKARFTAEAGLGVVRIGRERVRKRSVSQLPPLDLPASGFAVRGDLWMSLGGLDEAFRSVGLAIRDLFLRARAIGFVAPERIGLIEDDLPVAAIAADRRLYRRHARIAPDRSGRGRRMPTVEPEQLTIYTAITDCYDMLKPQAAATTGGSPRIAFLDEPTAALHGSRTRGWRLASVDLSNMDGRRASRYYKANAHLALPHSPYSLWTDASISLVAPFPVRRLAELFLGDCDICVFRHYARRSVYDEAEACKAAGRDRAETIDAQIDRYRREGLPRHSGLAELPVILRRHSAMISAFNEAWWAEIAAGSWRDQLSFNYVAWKAGLRYATFPLSIALQNGLFLKFRRTA